MLNVLVLLLFFALLGGMLFGEKSHQYLWVLVSIVLFPACLFFVKSPQLSPQHVFLYLFFVINICTNFSELKVMVFKLPILFALICIAFSLMMSAYVSGTGVKGLYNAFRLFWDNYSYWFVAFGAGFCYKKISLENKLFYPVMIFFILGLIEFLTRDNFVFKIICNAFPIYEGFFDLNGVVSLSRSYRSKLFISTVHPTTLGAMLCCTLIFFVTSLKNISWKRSRIWMVGGALAILLILCGSRTAQVVSLFGIALFLLQKANLKIKIVTAIITLIVAIFSIQMVIQKFSVEGEGSSLSLRQEQLLFSYLHFSKSPIFGNGIRYTSKYVMERDAYNDRVTDSTIGGLESIIFYQMIDHGIVGLFTYFLLYLMCFIYFFRRRRFSYANGGILLTICFFAFACLSGEIGGNNIFAYMLIGYCMGATYVQEREEKDEKDETIQLDEGKKE